MRPTRTGRAPGVHRASRHGPDRPAERDSQAVPRAGPHPAMQDPGQEQSRPGPLHELGLAARRVGRRPGPLLAAVLRNLGIDSIRANNWHEAAVQSAARRRDCWVKSALVTDGPPTTVDSPAELATWARQVPSVAFDNARRTTAPSSAISHAGSTVMTLSSRGARVYVRVARDDNVLVNHLQWHRERELPPVAEDGPSALSRPAPV